MRLVGLRNGLAALLLTTVVAAWLPGRAAEIANASIHLRFDDRTGALLSLTDPARGSPVCEPAPDDGALWHLLLGHSNEVIRPEEARTFRAQRGGAAGDVLTLSWSDFALFMPRLQVRATVRLERAGRMALWSLEVSGLGANKLQSVIYPRLRNLQTRSNETVAVPLWLGQLLRHPRETISGPAHKNGRFQWDYPGLLSLQCIAVYGEVPGGLYLACNDTAAFRKKFALKGDASGALHAEIEHLPERSSNDAEWTMPYAVLTGVMQGDWVTAAETYRAWATNQLWAKQSRVSRKLVPAWVRDTGLWMWNRGPSQGVILPALELQKRVDLPVSVFWHWWHGCAYDDGFPGYFPPREGTDHFKRALTEAHANQVRALVYMNQRLWGMNTPSWREAGAAKYAVKDAQGKIQPEIYNTFTKAPCASMCMGTRFWRDTYADLAERAIAELGVDGIYMDQACTSLACYDPSHPHPPGGGRYWMQGFQRLQQDIRERCAKRQGSPTPALAGEGCGEPWLPYLDVMLSLQVSRERYSGPDGWEPIPFFHAVYHPYAVSYGNYSSLTMPPYDELWPAATAPREPLRLLDRKFSTQFYLEQARAFVWGQQPTIANFIPSLLAQRAEEINYVIRLARIRAQARAFLQEGTFLRPPDLAVPTVKLNMSRLSIYAGQQQGVREFQMESPSVLASAWRSPAGIFGIALANISREELRVPLKLGAAHGAAADARVFRVDEHGRAPVGKASGDRLSVFLPPLGACVLEFRPEVDGSGAHGL